MADLEQAMRKSKAKYDALAEDYDRARTGDTSQKRTFGFKGTKTGAQLEEDLHRKVQVADQDYHSKVQTVQTERGELMAKTRPETVRALQDLVKECDSGVTLQLQKFGRLPLCIMPILQPFRHTDTVPSLSVCSIFQRETPS